MFNYAIKQDQPNTQQDPDNHTKNQHYSHKEQDLTKNKGDTRVKLQMHFGKGMPFGCSKLKYTTDAVKKGPSHKSVSEGYMMVT